MGEDSHDQGGQGQPRWLDGLHDAAHRGAIVLYGGELRRPKLARVRERLGIALDWVEGRHGARLAWRVRRGDVVAVVLMEGLLGHASSADVVRAARRMGIPYAYAGRGGFRCLLDALADLGRRLNAV